MKLITKILVTLGTIITMYQPVQAYTNTFNQDMADFYSDLWIEHGTPKYYAKYTHYTNLTSIDNWEAQRSHSIRQLERLDKVKS
jgi:hypothetical protein